MRIIIVGCGKVGTTLAEQLVQEGHNIALIDTNEDVLQKLSNTLDVIGIVGNGASYNVQMDAGIDKADLLIAITSSDELNLLCCLIAKKAGNCHTIARVRNPVYSEEINFIKEELGLSMIINPELATAKEIAKLLKFPSAIKIDTFAKGKIELLKFQIGDNSILNNMFVSQISSSLHCDILICAIERGEEVIIPSGNFLLNSGDKVSIIASSQNASDFFKKIGMLNNQVKNIMLIGGGKISYYLSKQLLDMGIDVKIIEKSKERCEYLSDLLPEAMIIHGDATDQALLQEEGLAYTEAFASLTNYDEENIMLSLYAKSKCSAKLITKVNRIPFENIINNLSIGSIIYPKFITSERILQYVRSMQNSLGSNIETLCRIVNHKVEALEFRVRENSKLIGIPLEKLKLKDNLLISCINRNGKIIIPKGQDTINFGDTVIIVTTNTGLNDLKDIIKEIKLKRG